MDLSKIKLTEEEFAELEDSGFNAFKENAFIKKVGNEWCIFSMSNKPMGCYKSKKKAEERLQVIEMFKHMKSGKEISSLWECYCEDEGLYFYSSKPCYKQRCTQSGDDAIEVTGEI